MRYDAPDTREVSPVSPTRRESQKCRVAEMVALDGRTQVGQVVSHESSYTSGPECDSRGEPSFLETLRPSVLLKGFGCHVLRHYCIFIQFSKDKGVSFKVSILIFCLYKLKFGHTYIGLLVRHSVCEKKSRV